MASPLPRPELSLVIPIYNEEEVLPQLDVRLKELLNKLAIDTEVVFVNDGSKDKSIDLLRRLASRETRYRVLGFSRNFGHQRAITAGMDKSRGQAVVVMDADLQDPPEVILEMVAKWREGYDVVYGRRRSRVGESWFKLFTAKMFYRLFAAMIPIEVPLDTGDFRLMSRRVVTTLRGLRETHRFVRGLVAWVGFKQTAVEYDRAARAAGETKYPLSKMLAFAIDGIASFSIQPLRLATYVGVFVGTASVLYAVASVLTWAAGMNVPGWTTTVVLVSFLFSVQFFMIGVLGEYVGRIYEQVKRRPLYIVSERINFGRRKVEKLITQDLADLEVPEAPEGAAPIPPPPPALFPAPGEVRPAHSRPPPAPSPSRAPPALPGTPKPLPVKLSSSVANMHVAPAKPAPAAPKAAPAPGTPSTTPVRFPTTPPKTTTPSADAKKKDATPSIPPPAKADDKKDVKKDATPSVPPPAKAEEEKKDATPSVPPPEKPEEKKDATPSDPPPAKAEEKKDTPSVPPPAKADDKKDATPAKAEEKKDATPAKAEEKKDATPSAPPAKTEDATPSAPPAKTEDATPSVPPSKDDTKSDD